MPLIKSNSKDEKELSPTTSSATIAVPAISGTPQTETVALIGQQRGTTQFSDCTEEALYTQPSKADPTFASDAIEIGQLGDFLSRPTLIYTATWLQGTNFAPVFRNVWKDYFEAPAIKRKIENYAFFQGEIHMKVMINSSPFNYGAIIAAYEPLIGHGYDLSTADDIASLRTCEFSQFPHVWILPATSQGGEIVFPFMYDLDWLDLTRLSEVSNMGVLHFLQVEPLISCNGSVGQDCDIQLYVWFEKVKLSGLTHRAPLQMGVMSEVSDRVPQMWKAATAKSMDEYAKRPVSSIASTIAAVAKPLTSVPIIGMFAKATNIGASAVSKIASLFGFTNPPNIANVEPVRQAPYHGFASASVSVPGDTLTLDPKCELSIDPRTAGLSDYDELAIANIAQREAYFGKVYWDTTDPPQTTLMGTYVSPLQWMADNLPGDLGDQVAMTPTGLLSRTFAYWRGDIIFRFKIICTAYHRGRLRFSWDPVASLFNSAANNNTALNRIVDITQEQDIEIRIPYNQARHWLATGDFGGAYSLPPLRTRGGIFSDLVPNTEQTNGIFQCLVLNALSAPEPSASASILMFVRGAPNLEFCVPKLPFDRTVSYFRPQSGEISISGAHDDDTDQLQYMVYFGDPVRSLRSVMRRAYPNVTLVANSTTATNGWSTKYITWNNSVFPYFNGYDPSSNFSANKLAGGTPPTAPYTCCLNTPFHMWIPCFKGMRGSIYWHFEHQNMQLRDRLSLEVRREVRDPSTAGGRLVWSAISTFLSSTVEVKQFNECFSYDNNGLEDTRSASVLISPFNGEGKSVLFPNLFNYRFDTTRVSAMVTGLNRPRPRRECVRVMARYAPVAISDSNAENNIFVRRYFSIGPDFTVFFFLCVPRIYRSPGLPTMP